MLIDFFAEHDLSFTNMIGFGADGANVMMGARHSVAALLRTRNPDVFLFKCICHSFHLCASKSGKAIPEEIEILLRDVHNYLSTSPKRTNEMKVFRSIWELKPNKMLHPSATRWLSLDACVQRILENYLPVKNYFKVEALLHQQHVKVQHISKMLEDPSTKAYLKFLKFVLPLFNQLNVEMQSETFKLHVLYNRIYTVLKVFLEFFIKPEYLKSDISEIIIDDSNVDDNPIYLSLSEVYFGGETTQMLLSNEWTDEQKTAFQKNARYFYVLAVIQIKKRFSFKNNEFLKNLDVIDPKNMDNKQSIIPLVIHCKHIINENELNDIDLEYRLVRNMPDMPEDISAFWAKVCNLKNNNDELTYPLLSKLITHILSLPHSSANVERIFSTININKTKLRNRLTCETLEGILYAKAPLKENVCYNVNITNGHLKKFNTNMYDHKQD